MENGAFSERKRYLSLTIYSYVFYTVESTVFPLVEWVRKYYWDSVSTSLVCKSSMKDGASAMLVAKGYCDIKVRFHGDCYIW